MAAFQTLLDIASNKQPTSLVQLRLIRKISCQSRVCFPLTSLSSTLQCRSPKTPEQTG
jgi:hypothetical protein